MIRKELLYENTFGGKTRMKTKDNILCTCIIRKDTPAGLYFGDICR